MKTLLALPALALCLMLTACADSTTPAPDAEITEAANKVEANITGMTCTGCSGQVCDAVEKVAGVTKAWADPKTGQVTVALEDDADTDAALKEVQATIIGLSDGKYSINEIAYVSSQTKACAEGCTKDCCKTPAEDAPAEDAATDERATEEQAGTESTEAFVFTSYKVSGMDCSGCSSQIVKAVEQVDGVKQIEADHVTGAVKVSIEDRFDDKVKTDEIKDLIAGLSNGKYTVSY